MKLIGILAILSFVSAAQAITADIQCTDDSGNAVSFDFRAGNARIYVCSADQAPCDASTNQNSVQELAQITQDSPVGSGVYTVPYRIISVTGSHPILPRGASFDLSLSNDDNTYVQITSNDGSLNLSCSTGLGGDN